MHHTTHDVLHISTRQIHSQNIYRMDEQHVGLRYAQHASPLNCMMQTSFVATESIVERHMWRFLYTPLRCAYLHVDSYAKTRNMYPAVVCIIVVHFCGFGKHAREWEIRKSHRQLANVDSYCRTRREMCIVIIGDLLFIQYNMTRQMF